MKIGIIGTGAYAIAIASILEKNNIDITMWTKLENEYNELIQNHQNTKVLNYRLDDKIKFTMNLSDVAENTNLIILALPSMYIKDTINELKPYWKNQTLLVTTKGMLENQLLHEYLKQELNTEKIVCLAGPTFANDIIKKEPIGFTIASNKEEVSEIVLSLFKDHSYIRMNYTKDIIGVELWSILKNILAIAAGILNGMNLSISTITRFLVDAIHDIQNIILQLNGQKETFFLYAGIGDFFLTTTNQDSRNFTLGKLIGAEKDILDYKKNTTIEGLDNLKNIYLFLQKNNIDSKIIDILYKIVYQSKPKELILDYFNTK